MFWLAYNTYRRQTSEVKEPRTFLVRNRHLWMRVGDDARREIISMLVIRMLVPFSHPDHCALLSSCFDERFQAIEASAIDHGTDVHSVYVSLW